MQLYPVLATFLPRFRQTACPTREWTWGFWHAKHVPCLRAMLSPLIIGTSISVLKKCRMPDHIRILGPPARRKILCDSFAKLPPTGQVLELRLSIDFYWSWGLSAVAHNKVWSSHKISWGIVFKIHSLQVPLPSERLFKNNLRFKLSVRILVLALIRIWSNSSCCYL